MFCPYCGRILEERDNFCPECHRPVTEEGERIMASRGTSREVPRMVYAAYFAIGFIIMFHLTFFFRISFFVFVIPLLFLGGGWTKIGSVALGLTAGTIAGLRCHYLL